MKTSHSYKIKIPFQKSSVVTSQKDIITAHVTTELIITMDQIQWINL